MNSIKATVAILVLLIVLVYSSCYTVTEGQAALLVRLGQLVMDPQTKQVAVHGPGLHFKWPLIETVRLFDMRLQTLGLQSSRIVTAQKKDVLVDFYVKWRIKDLPRYLKSTMGNEQTAAMLLRPQLNDGLRTQFGKRTIAEVVSDDRSKIMEELLKQANRTASEFGVDVVDVRIKRIDLPNEVSTAVFERMRAERERVATEHRSEGKAKGEAIRANADAKVTVILAQAQAQSAKIRAEGEAIAAKIYGDVFGQDPEFYAFYRSLLAYQDTFNTKRDILILKPDNQFFKYFGNLTGNTSAASANKNNP